MTKRNLLGTMLFVLALIPLLSMGQQTKSLVNQIDIKYTKYVLDNGLTLLVHEDHKAPIVAYNVWYHVGSKNEKAGRTGFAHLFEHLMFNGSENHNDDYFKPMQKIGATDLNGTTNEDRTNYFENVPVGALDFTLFMESDRMGHLLGAIDQARLDEQRGVVQNEKRQGDNQPFGVTEELITKGCFMPGHPYSWTVIGSMEDLSAAKVEDVKEWFTTYYGPNNAVICLAGDITPEVALEKVKKYFGDIKPGPPIARYKSWPAKRSGTARQQVQDLVPQYRIYKIWNVPEFGNKEAVYVDLVSDVLSMGKTSRLYKRLVYDEQLVTNVSATTDLREIAGLFTIQADAKPGVDVAKIEKAIDEELARLIAEGPTEAELSKIKTLYFSNFIRGIERIGGFGGKSDILAYYECITGDAANFKRTLNYVENASAKDLQNAAKTWLSDGAYVLEVLPFSELNAAEKGVDRSKFPEVTAGTDAKFPEIQRAKLSNGLEIVLAEQHSIPVVRMNLLFDAGYAADLGGTPGTANLAMDLMDEGTAKRNSLQISEDLANLGAGLSTGSNLDQSYVRLNTLKMNLDPALEIFMDVLLNPSLPEKDFKRLQKMLIARIQREKSSPFSIAQRAFPGILYGQGHVYGNPWTGTGYEDAAAKITLDDLKAFHKKWLKPNNATLLIVGDIKMDEIKPKLEKLLKEWKSGDVPKKNIAKVELKKKQVVYIFDKPGSPQSEVFAAHLAPSSSEPDDISTETMNFVLGGDFVSRINMNIREDKNWSYGASSFFMSGKKQRPLMVYAPVQSDKTKETIQEIMKEIDGVLGKKPITQDELGNAIKAQTISLPGQWETQDAIEGSMQQLVRYSWPDDYYKTYAGKVRSLKLKDLNNSATKTLQPASLQWLIVGDKALIEKGIRELGIDEIYEVDGDGKIIKKE